MTPSERYELLQEIAITIADYREGEINKPTPEHVERWVIQFDAEEQLAILQETAHLLGQTYITKSNVTRFIQSLASNQELVGDDAKSFWKSVQFLRIQRNSKSQEEMLGVLEDTLGKIFPISAHNPGSQSNVYLYLDDMIFSGNQLRYDLIRWAETNDVHDSTVHVIVIGLHKAGHRYASREIRKVFGARAIQLQWWSANNIEDWRTIGNENNVHVLWPSAMPDDPHVQRWLDDVPEDRTRFSPRRLSVGGKNDFFASEETRNILEQAFLKKGAYIRSLSRNPSASMRPLGFNKLKGAGFGTMFATFRNCPNNCPLVLWWGDPNGGQPLNQWYPLLPRRVRQDDFGFEAISAEELEALFGPSPSETNG